MRCEHFSVSKANSGFDHLGNVIWQYVVVLLNERFWELSLNYEGTWLRPQKITEYFFILFFNFTEKNFQLFSSLPFLLPQVYSLKFMITMATYFFNLIPVILSKKPQNKRKARIFVCKKTIWNTFVLQLRTLNFELGNPMSYEYVGRYSILWIDSSFNWLDKQ